MTERDQSMSANHNQRTVKWVLLLVVAMFGFGFALVPLYDVFCEITGLNGKTGGRYEAVPVAVDTSRTIKVQFIAPNNEGMPWEFGPVQEVVRVHPGEQKQIEFFARNTTGRDMVAQAVPSVVPYKAAEFFHKMECFCFNRQPLKAGDSAELPMIFTIDQDIPKQVHTITLSYTLFDVTDMDAKAPSGDFKWGKG